MLLPGPAGKNPKTFMAIPIVFCSNYCPRWQSIDLLATLIPISCIAIPLLEVVDTTNKPMELDLEEPFMNPDCSWRKLGITVRLPVVI